MTTPDATTPTSDPSGTLRLRQGDATLVVHRMWCKGCDLCIRSCPVQILSLARDRRIQVEDIDRCIFCGMCAVRCPDFVFSLERPAPTALATQPTAQDQGR